MNDDDILINVFQGFITRSFYNKATICTVQNTNWHAQTISTLDDTLWSFAICKLESVFFSSANETKGVTLLATDKESGYMTKQILKK